jgi:uncharacterized protein (DUF2237 family)
MMGKRGEVLSGLPASLVRHGLGQACTRLQHVHKVAIECVCNPPQSFQRDGVLQLTSLHFGDALLAYTYSGRQLGTRHAERISDGSDPASMWARLIGKWLKALKACVEPLSSLGIVCHGTHSTRLVL